MFGDITPDPTNPVVIGGGTAESTTDPFPCTYDEWWDMFGSDNNGDSQIDEKDFARWWSENNFTQADWERLNPTLPWDTYFGN